jgi:glycosyltransferase involved in cell wall biosynthesis
MKKVLSLVFNNFKNDTRVLKECQALQKAGYCVQVIALHEEALAEKEIVQDLRVHRIKLATRNWSKSLPVQLIKYNELALRIFFQYTGFDIIHCHDLAPLPIAIALKLLSGRKIKVVYDAHEFEAEVNGLKGIRKKSSCLVEKTLIRFVDATITVSNSIAEAYAKRYRISKPALVLNCPPRTIVKKNNKFREKFGIPESKMIFLYQGGLSHGRGIEMLLEAFQRIGQNRVVVILMGYGPLEEKIKKISNQSSNIFLHPAVSPEELWEYTGSADIGVVAMKNTCLNHYYCLPNKFFEYAMAGLPILVNNLPEMRSLIEKYDCGQIVEEETMDSFIAAIQQIACADLSRYSVNARKLSRDYNWKNQEKVLINVYKTLI